MAEAMCRRCLDGGFGLGDGPWRDYAFRRGNPPEGIVELWTDDDSVFRRRNPREGVVLESSCRSGVVGLVAIDGRHSGETGGAWCDRWPAGKKSGEGTRWRDGLRPGETGGRRLLVAHRHVAGPPPLPPRPGDLVPHHPPVGWLKGKKETQDFYKSQIEILKKEMQCMSKGFIEERKVLQREMQLFYQNSQLQLNEQISEQQRRMEQIWGQFNTLISDTSTPGDHVKKHTNHRCCNDKFSRHVITADDGSPIKVAIYDHDNKIITNGPLSSMQVRIVVMNGEFNKDNKVQWNRDSFLQNIVYGRPGKLPLFANELYLRLENGVANLYGAKFQDNSSFLPSKQFRHKLLQHKGIKTEGDFLCFFHKNPKELRKILGNISDQDWDMIINHALKCKPRPANYSSYTEEMNVHQEHESFHTSNGNCYLKGSCSMQPSPAPANLPVSENHTEQIDIQLSKQHASRFLQQIMDCHLVHHGEYLNKAKFHPNTLDQSVKAYGEFQTMQASQEVSTIENEVLSRVSEEQLSQVSTSAGDTMEEFLASLEKDLLQDDSRSDFTETYWGDAYNAVKQTGGLPRVNEAHNMSRGGISPASEVGSTVYGGISPASEVGSRSYTAFSPSPQCCCALKPSKDEKFKEI
uniref:Calmodulin binding protein-like N-terminal domain-containing protein n=1 Tax=Oryza rufipogon TaxID=4529 RepID=A0A0E0RBU3_ORYRU